MGALNSSNVLGYGDVNQRIVWSLPGTAFPTTPYPTSWGAGWLDLGIISDAGVTESQANQETKEYAWQGGLQIATLRSQFERSFKFVAKENKAEVLRLARPNYAITTVAGTAEVQVVTFNAAATAGTWALTLPGYGTASGLAFNVSTATLATTLATAFNLTGIAVTGTAGTTYTVTYPTTAGNLPQLSAVIVGLTGPTSYTSTTTTPGVPPFNTGGISSSSGRNLLQFGIDLISGSVHRRLMIGFGEATPDGDTVYAGTATTSFGFTLQCYPDANGFFYTEVNDSPVLTQAAFG